MKRKCSLKGCNEPATFSTPNMKAFCSSRCATKYAAEVIRNEKVPQIKRFKGGTRGKSTESKSLSQVCSYYQKDVNRMIRAVDRLNGYKCIATGSEISDAGHFYHAGSKYRISWLRFFHGNIHGQGKKSNRYGRGTEEVIDYQQGIIDRYGQSYLNDLNEFKRMEDSGLIPKPSKSDVQAMAKWCRAMARIYEKRV